MVSHGLASTDVGEPNIGREVQPPLVYQASRVTSAPANAGAARVAAARRQLHVNLLGETLLN
jgi:hypothetical protein